MRRAGRRRCAIVAFLLCFERRADTNRAADGTAGHDWIESARKAIDESNELGDLDTADLFSDVSRGIDEWLWFVEAHSQAD
jgi:hypothetical protein